MLQQKQYKGRKAEWTVLFSLNDNIINILIHNQKTLNSYNASINQDKIKDDKNFGFFFEHPLQLFIFLQSSFSELSITPEGMICIDMDMPVGKIKKKVEFRIPTILKQSDPAQMTEIKMMKMQKDIQELQKQNKNHKLKLELRQEELAKMKEELGKFQKVLQQKDEVINSIFSELKEISRWKDQKERLVEDVFKNKRKFIPDQTNSHNLKFTQIGNRYKKNCGGSWDILMCKHEFQKNQIYKYHIKQLKAGMNGSFMYGIGTSAVKGINRAQDHKQFIGYYQNTGNIYDRGESRKGGVKVKDGDTLTIQIDTRVWKLTWIVQGNKEAQLAISQELRSKPLFLAIIVYNDESEIEFI